MVVDNVLDAVGDVVNVLGGDTADGDTAIFSHVNAVFFHHRFALLYGQAGEGEHSNLSGDMRPVALHFLFLKGTAKCVAHVVHPSAHDNEFVEPLLAHLWVVQDRGRNSGSVLGWGRVVRSHDDLDLGKDALGCDLVSADEVQATGTLTVETHDLGERLSDDHLEAL